MPTENRFGAAKQYTKRQSPSGPQMQASTGSNRHLKVEDLTIQVDPIANVEVPHRLGAADLLLTAELLRPGGRVAFPVQKGKHGGH